jgi:flagellar basal body-associated protein FliL
MTKKRLIWIILILAFIIVGGAVTNMFLFGSVMPAKRITVIDIAVTDRSVTVNGNFLQDSALAYRGFKYRIEGHKLYIKIYKTLVSPLYKYGFVKVVINEEGISDVSKIYIEDGKDNRLIWEK